jgi:hypothetical protein
MLEACDKSRDSVRPETPPFSGTASSNALASFLERFGGGIGFGVIHTDFKIHAYLLFCSVLVFLIELDIVS